MPFYSRPAGVTKNWPMVFRNEPHHAVKFGRAWQEFLFGLNRSPDALEDYKDFLAYTKSDVAMFNGTGIFDTNGIQRAHDYIGNTGIGLPDPKQFTLIFGRNVLCGEEVTLTERQGALVAGTRALKVETLNAPDPRVTYATHPHLVHVANIIVNIYAPKYDGLRMVNAFPMRGGRMGYPVYFPVASDGRQMYYPLNRLARVRQGAPLPTPYNPA